MKARDIITEYEGVRQEIQSLNDYYDSDLHISLTYSELDLSTLDEFRNILKEEFDISTQVNYTLSSTDFIEFYILTFDDVGVTIHLKSKNKKIEPKILFDDER